MNILEIRDFSFSYPDQEKRALTEISLDIKEGTQSGEKLKLKGKGLKTPDSYKKGDMYVITKVITPTKLDRNQKCLLKELSETILNSNSAFKNFNQYL